MTIMKRTLSVIAVAAASFGVAVAQANPAPGGGTSLANPTGVVQNFDPSTLGPLLSELGISWNAQQGSDGRTFIAANIGGQLNVNFIPSACLENGARNCVGLNTLAYFEGGAPNPQSVSAFNQKYWFVSAGVVSGGKGAYISRYEIADYGIPRGNVESSLRNFVVLASKFRDEIRSGAKTVSLDGYADDLSASLLNNKSVQAIGGAVETSTDNIHLGGFEEAPEVVKVFLSDPNAPKNKIDNIIKQ
ncbi:MAG: YbjN domain-containing protein [Pseudomonadota bacterium]